MAQALLETPRVFKKLHTPSIARSCSLLLLGLLLLTSSVCNAFTISWDASLDPTVLGYRVHYGTSSGNYTMTVDAGKANSLRITDPPAGVTYYAVVTAYAFASIESLPSEEVSYTSKSAEAILPTQLGAGRTDFNGDGKADIVWRNENHGEIIIWLMNGAEWTGAVTLGAVSTDWQLADTGDFNGDGKSDLFWRNTNHGQNIIWLMNGTDWMGTVDLGVVSTDWRLAK
jgi:hypothetical protein